jgi:argininosuccinate lyase
MSDLLWSKPGVAVDAAIQSFLAGDDVILDREFFLHDIRASRVHAEGLQRIGILSQDELHALARELAALADDFTSGAFVLDTRFEDGHSAIEARLTERLGDTGRKIHTGRSRNDQVLVATRLWLKDKLSSVAAVCRDVAGIALARADVESALPMPGYTHLQVAMPSSFGLWFSAYAESLVDDLRLVQTAYRITDQNPLGSAAGYGSSFPLNRQFTTDLLGFESMNYNVVYAQMGRGKVEKTVAFALASIAGTLSKLAYDVCLFMSQNFGFVALPDELTTGSSIMPHKKNPDVFELLRSHCNRIQSVPGQILLMTNNLPSGYFRDLQLIKEVFIPVFDELNSCISIAAFAIENIKVNKQIMEDERYKFAYSVEVVNKLVLNGVPFRDAYRKVGEEIQQGNFNPDKKIAHTHEGSIGNLCLNEIKFKMKKLLVDFNFKKADDAILQLISEN